VGDPQAARFQPAGGLVDRLLPGGPVGRRPRRHLRGQALPALHQTGRGGVRAGGGIGGRGPVGVGGRDVVLIDLGQFRPARRGLGELFLGTLCPRAGAGDPRTRLGDLRAPVFTCASRAMN